jgi:TATA-box binding protein (TBP) (component of TFIID and TFIIIB)
MGCIICDPKCKYENCICGEKFCSFDYILKNFADFNTLNESKFTLIKPWSISTITAVCNFNSKIDVKKYIDIYGKDCLKKQFYNCLHYYIGVKYQPKTKISVKIFSNGKIQMAGVLNVTAISYAVRKIFKRLSKIQALEKDAFISGVKVCMINSDFKINKTIKQKFLCKLFDEKNLSYIKRYSFNPNKYPAINIKINNEDSISACTCLIFRSGSIIITGGNDVSEYLEVYKNIIKLFEENYEDILV